MNVFMRNRVITFDLMMSTVWSPGIDNSSGWINMLEIEMNLSRTKGEERKVSKRQSHIESTVLEM